MASLSGITAALKFTNGFLVSLVGILPFVATLGTLTMYSGIAFLASDGKTIFGRDIPKGFSSIARSGIELESLGLKIPFLSILALVVLFVVWFTLEHTPFGRRLYASGGNNEAARLAGVKVRQLRTTAFALTGLGAAIGGLMLHAIAAVFLGMTISEEGEPRVLATLVGVLMLGLLDNGLTQMSVDSFVREILVGAIILAAVASSSIGKQRG